MGRDEERDGSYSLFQMDRIDFPVIGIQCQQDIVVLELRISLVVNTSTIPPFPPRAFLPAPLYPAPPSPSPVRISSFCSRLKHFSLFFLLILGLFASSLLLFNFSLPLLFFDP